MTAYFVATEATHLAYLPVEWRTSPHIARLAPRIEAEVIAAFTPRSPYVPPYAPPTTDTSGEAGVQLLHYTVDADACTSTAFKTAMVQTIANILQWRAVQETRNPGAISESGRAGTGSAVTYREDAYAHFPLGWDVYLRPYDQRPPIWGF